MPSDHITLQTDRLNLRLDSAEEARERVAAMPPEFLEQVSPAWLAKIREAKTADPWLHGFSICLREGGDAPVGSIGFKGPPDADHVVEVAYGIEEAHQGKGYATEALRAAVDFALSQTHVSAVCAHTLPETNASTAVLKKCGFAFKGDVIDPEDGPVWRWEHD